jgi:hypothetical protein
MQETELMDPQMKILTIKKKTSKNEFFQLLQEAAEVH